MNLFDDALREALRREDPGPEFTARVLARAAATQPAKASWWFWPLRMRWVAACALACLLVVGGSVEYRERQTRLEGERAKKQLVLALRIAGTKLNLVREKVEELNGRNERVGTGDL